MGKDMGTFIKRLELAMPLVDIADHSQAELARRLTKQLGRHISRSTVNVWFKAKKPVAIDPIMLVALSDVLKVNIRWLIMGPPYQMGKVPPLTLEDIELLQIGTALRRLSPENYEKWISTGRSLVAGFEGLPVAPHAHKTHK